MKNLNTQYNSIKYETALAFLVLLLGLFFVPFLCYSPSIEEEKNK